MRLRAEASAGVSGRSLRRTGVYGGNPQEGEYCRTQETEPCFLCCLEYSCDPSILPPHTGEHVSFLIARGIQRYDCYLSRWPEFSGGAGRGIDSARPHDENAFYIRGLL